MTVLSLRQQASIRNDWLRQRLDTVLPEIMRREGFDMWLVIAREYNEDPVVMTLLPEPAMSARRRTILLFAFDRNGDFHRRTLSRYGMDGYYDHGWNPDEEDQDACLRRTIAEFDPQTIGINVSGEFAFGDGLSHHEYTQLAAALGETYMARTRSAERLCVGWLERRIPPEIDAYGGIVAMGHTLIAETFSNRVIHPGVTTTEDVVWYMRQRILDMGLQAWFQPGCEIQAADQSYGTAPGLSTPKRTLIQRGDLLWCDVGFYYLGLATDQQQHAYVLKPGETDAPDGLKHALAQANRFQEIVMGAMQVSRSGNHVLKSAKVQAQAEHIDASLYSHPLGYHGHAAGPTIGLWDQQDGVPGRGDYTLFDDTAYSVELNIKANVPEWNGQEVRIALEEDAVLTGGQMHWLNGHQTAFHLID
jgi:hypothetical protein